MQLREWILTYGFSKKGDRFNGNLSKLDSQGFISQLHEATSYIASCKLALRMRLFLSGWSMCPTCPFCGKDLIPNVRSEFPTFCNAKCANNFKPIRDKIKQTNYNRYGGPSPANSSAVREKIEQTCLNKYGEKHFLSTKEARQNLIRVSKARYGWDHPAQSNIVKDKIKNTNRARYGCENTFQVEVFKDKSKATCRRRYGKDYAMQNRDIFASARVTCQTRYDADYPQQENLPVEVNDPDSIRRGLTKHSPIELAKKWDISISTLYRYAKKNGISFDSSMEEAHIVSYLKDLGVTDIITSSRSIIPPLELDIYLPEYNIAIEYDGVYWHTEGRGKLRNYHLSKTEQCGALGIHLLHIFSSDPTDIWKSVIAHKLGKSKHRIGGRQTTLRAIDYKEEREFLENNHLQGYVNSREAFGLFYESVLVSCMTFSHSRFGNSKWELLRFCVKKDWNVIGAAGKLLAHFKKAQDGSLVSYANRRWSDGSLYRALGMTLSHISPPNFFYTRDYRTLSSRNQFQKHRLSDRLDTFDPSLTAHQNMLIAGYDRIWDCGNYVFTS